MAFNFMLEKLKIKAYNNRSRAVAAYVGSFEAMFNPESFSQRYAIVYANNQGLNSTGKAVNYSRSKPSDLKIKLVLDGTGANRLGMASLLAPQKTVSEQIKAFLDLAYHMNGSTHEPNFLVVEWGDLNFSCRLGAVDISYTSFDRSGKALRAELDLTLVADQETRKRLALENKSSPDLTHSRIVKNGDTLPLLAKEIYGSSSYYRWVAENNGLDDFRHLRPGQQLTFPPLTDTNQG